MKRRVAIVAAVMGVLNLFAVAPAGATCRVIVEELGCTERILCAPGAKLGWECIE